MTSERSSSSRPSPLIQQGDELRAQDNMSMFFNFGTPLDQDAPDGSSYQLGAQSSTESHESAPRTGGIRVSLACIPVSNI